MIGKHISPILEEIEATLWEFESATGSRPDYPVEALRAAVKIFMSILMDKMWELQEWESMSFDDRVSMVQKAGREVRNIVKTYTNIDTHDLYKK